MKVNGWNHESSLGEDSTTQCRYLLVRYLALFRGRSQWVIGLRLVVHFLFPRADALTGGMTRAAVSECMRKVARDGFGRFLVLHPCPRRSLAV